MYYIFFLICLLSSVIGAICGIGGGVIIKPVLDAYGVLSVSQISFLSGCTVLSMSSYSVLSAKKGEKSLPMTKYNFGLVLGASVGGFVGKLLFQGISFKYNLNWIGRIQAICLLIITIATLVYTINKNKIRTRHIMNLMWCIMIGMSLGIMSSFLGIGGGPMNLVVLFYFFSMDTKTAARNSLYIIFLSQLVSLAYSFFSGNIPNVSLDLLILMMLGGILGGIIGNRINSKIHDFIVDKLFIGLMVIIIGINIYNICKFI